MLRLSSLVVMVMLLALLGCGGKPKIVADKDAAKVKMEMTKKEVESLVGRGRSVGTDSYEWKTDKGKTLTVGFFNDKVASMIFGGAPTKSEEK